MYFSCFTFQFHACPRSVRRSPRQVSAVGDLQDHFAFNHIVDSCRFTLSIQLQAALCTAMNDLSRGIEERTRGAPDLVKGCNNMKLPVTSEASIVLHSPRWCININARLLTFGQGSQNGDGLQKSITWCKASHASSCSNNTATYYK